MSGGQEPKLYSSTAGTYFTDKESLAEHYRSELHQYNLRRKVAGLPPVTREWFEARKDQLQGTATAAPQKTWFDPLTKKRFGSENTYLAHVNSKRYKDLVSKSGAPAPEPIISLKRHTATSAAKSSAQASPTGYRTSVPNGVVPEAEQASKARTVAAEQPGQPGGSGYESEEEDDEDAESEWETASEEDLEEASHQPSSAGDPQHASSSSQASTTTGVTGSAGEDGPADQWEPWNACRSLFDNHMSPSTEANLEYMWKKFGFYIPDSQYLADPEGLIKYLGAKIQYGGVPLYVRGDDEKARQYRSLHSVQRHMIDTNQCKMVYDDNEEEYEDYYDYESDAAADEASTSGQQLMVGGTDEPVEAVTNGYELSIPADEAGGTKGKVLGSREFARFYKQRPRLDDTRHSVAVNKVLARYRSLGVALLEGGGASQEEKQARKQTKNIQQKFDRLRLRNDMRSNVIRNLPQNVPY